MLVVMLFDLLKEKSKEGHILHIEATGHLAAPLGLISDVEW